MTFHGVGMDCTSELYFGVMGNLNLKCQVKLTPFFSVGSMSTPLYIN